MFILTKIADLVQITPEDFHKKSSDAIEDNINAKYANKAEQVIQKIGLCICLYDLLWASEGLVRQGTGNANVNAEFRLVVFRPFKGEVIMAKISKCTPEGIHVRTEFFSDIFVEAEELPDGCQFDHNEQLWVWNNDETGPMWWDVHETVRLAVIGEEWHDQTPTKPTVAPGEDQPEEQRKPPYVIKGSMKNPGLGCTLWWEF
ncbi:putative dna-directed rna polymerase iii polypeptide [Diaporthe ampelina]|uniref:DNA-directed RNA polymerase subunit n=1 Tax=Diaporthe ampelina TaxID=1214573 RepID=A0A0G2F4E5_9PEZI|nr:putative dna-directed rna polymerase iii polypeptide [Diaporthe ampelina]